MLPLLTLLAAFATPPDDSLLQRGVSHALARYRAAHVSDVQYDLALDVTSRDTATGTARITFNRANGGDVILDFRGYTLDDVRVNGASTGSAQWKDAHLAIASAALRDGRNVIEARFRSPIAPAGAAIIRFTDDTDQRDYLYTLLVPSDAHLLFPCFDQPDLKATFDLTLSMSEDWSGLSNGRVVAEDPVANREGVQAVRFARTKPIPTYLFAFAAGPFARLHDAAGDIDLWVRASRAREVDADTLIALSGSRTISACRIPSRKWISCWRPPSPSAAWSTPARSSTTRSRSSSASRRP